MIPLYVPISATFMSVSPHCCPQLIFHSCYFLVAHCDFICLSVMYFALDPVSALPQVLAVKKESEQQDPLMSFEQSICQADKYLSIPMSTKSQN